MASKGQSGKRTRKAEPVQKENVWSFLIVVAKGIFQLVNNNKIYPTLALCLLSLIGLVVWRLPESDLAEISKMLINEIVVGKGGLIAFLVLTNAGWIYLTKRLRELYLGEIDRLSEMRKNLLHTNEQRDGKVIGNHRSSDDECKASYILPSKKGK